jgi:hypothetical protein
MGDDFFKDLFVLECKTLETFVKMYANMGSSDREQISVFSKIIAEIISRQEDPEGALKQFLTCMEDYFKKE